MPDKGHSWKLLLIQEAQTNQTKQMLNPRTPIYHCSRYPFTVVPPEEKALIPWLTVWRITAERDCISFSSLKSIWKAAEMATSYQGHFGFSNAISTSRDLKTELEYILYSIKRYARNMFKKKRKEKRGKKKKLKKKNHNEPSFPFTVRLTWKRSATIRDILSREIQEIDYIFIYCFHTVVFFFFSSF